MLPDERMVEEARQTMHDLSPQGASSDQARLVLTDAFAALDRDALIEAGATALPAHGPGGFGRYSPAHQRAIAEAVLRAVGLIQ